jgi:hypothetical protein
VFETVEKISCWMCFDSTTKPKIRKAALGGIACSDDSVVERFVHQLSGLLCVGFFFFFFVLVFVLSSLWSYFCFVCFQPEQAPAAAAAAAAQVKKKGNARDELELEIDFGDAGRKTNPKGFIHSWILLVVCSFFLFQLFRTSICTFSLSSQRCWWSFWRASLLKKNALPSSTPRSSRPICEVKLTRFVFGVFCQSFVLFAEKDETVRHSKCLGLLANARAKFDNDQALVLCQMYSFGAGVQLLYQKMEVLE